MAVYTARVDVTVVQLFLNAARWRCTYCPTADFLISAHMLICAIFWKTCVNSEVCFLVLMGNW